LPDISFTLNGTAVVLTDDGCSLLEALRDRLGVHSPKDGCSPQGQCGCCTVWVDGQPRVACVTPASRVRGRSVTTVEGLDPAVSTAWGEALCATGGSQCGFCTPGIVMRLEALRGSAPLVLASGRAKLDQALLAHLCRCTGWQTIREAAAGVLGAIQPGDRRASLREAEERAAIEGGTPQRVAPAVALGAGGFADDTAPPDALVAVRAADGHWVVAETLTAARAGAAKVQGRRTTEPASWPVDVPPGDWDRVLQTTWTEPAYLEPDASWCRPGGEPMSPLANGGAFGGKIDSEVTHVARELANRHGRPVRVLESREDVVRFGPKRPPLAVGARADGSGVVHVARTPGIAAAIRAVAPGLEVREFDVPGPRTSSRLRGAGWAEASVVLASLGAEDRVVGPSGADAAAWIDADGAVHVSVRAGQVLDAVVLRSYCIGAAHMALGWVRSESIAVDAEGRPHDLTIRSFGVLRAVDTPLITIEIADDAGPAVNGSDAVFAAVAAAAWRVAGHPARWPLQGAMP
jgi:aerobic-type carbon monoxide dehydrogenase small subunit (CoxS/CutS family)